MAWSACLLGVTLLLIPLPPPAKLGWMPLLRDACHAVVFAGMAWALMRLLRIHTRSAARAIWQTAVLLLLLAAGTELAQSFTGRNMDMADFVRDLAGTAAGIIAALMPSGKTLVLKAGLAALLMGPLVFSAQDLILRAGVVWQKSSAFPLLEDFEHRHAWRRWYLEHDGEDVPLRVVTLPRGRALQLDIPADGLTSLHGEALGSDWRSWTHLAFDCDLVAAAEVTLGVRIDSASDAGKRLSLQSVIKPGSGVATVPLPMDHASQELLRQTGQLVLFASDPGMQAILRLDNLRLERR